MRARTRGAIAAALVTTIPVPMATSPRASRVVSRQPPAARPTATGQSAGGPSDPPTTALDERGRRDEREVTDSRDGRVMLSGS